MGQYHYICNLDRREYLDPHKFGDGLKLLEFGSTANGTLTGLAVLLSEQNGRGGGDLSPRQTDDPDRVNYLMGTFVGRWAGDRIAIIGDYSQPGDKVVETYGTPWLDEEGWRDVSDEVVETIRLDEWVNSQFEQHRVGRFGVAQ